MSKTISEHLAGVKQAREDAHKKMMAVAQKSVDEGRSMNSAEQAEFDALKAEVKSLDADIERYSELESMQAKSAKPVGEQAEAAANRTVKLEPAQVRDTTKLEPGIAFARLARVKALAFTGQVNGLRDEASVAKAVYPNDDRLIASITKAGVSAASTLSDTWAGNLINEGGAAFADFVEYLRPRTLLGQIGSRLRRLPFDTPVLVQATAGGAKWTKEGVAKPLTQWTYTRTKLEPLKVAAIAVATKEMLLRASAAADALLRDELARAVGATIDTTFIDPAATAVTDTSPAGALNGVAATTLNSSTVTLDTIRSDIATLAQALVTGNQSLANAFWVIPETVAVSLSLAVNEVGAQAFPGMTPTGGTIAGLPVFVTNYAGTDSTGSVVALIKGDEIFFGDDGGVQVSMSDQASLVMDDGPTSNSTSPTAAQVVSMWQTNSVAFLVERFINWQRRRAQSLVWGRAHWTL